VVPESIGHERALLPRAQGVSATLVPHSVRQCAPPALKSKAAPARQARSNAGRLPNELLIRPARAAPLAGAVDSAWPSAAPGKLNPRGSERPADRRRRSPSIAGESVCQRPKREGVPPATGSQRLRERSSTARVWCTLNEFGKGPAERPRRPPS
jgi:hypothetical protein